MGHAAEDGLLDILFWRLREHYLNGQTYEARQYIAAIKAKTAMLHGMQRWALEELAAMHAALENINTPVRPMNRRSQYHMHMYQQSQHTEKPLEAEVVKAIVSGWEDFCNVSGITSAHIKSLEFITDDGRIDILAQLERELIIIEVKRERADHRIVAQVEKYRRWCELRRIFGLWAGVRAITVAASYTDDALGELTAAGVRTIWFEANKGTYKWNRIDGPWGNSIIIPARTH